MSFSVADIIFFKNYQFSDTKGGSSPRFALVLLPETATKYEGSVSCCVITSKETKYLALLLDKDKYKFFSKPSYACFNRKDLVSKSGLGGGEQPKGRLNSADKKKAWSILRKSFYVCNDLASSDSYIKGYIIYQWKKSLGMVS